MGQVKIFHDRTGNTMTVYFGNPSDEYTCSMTDEEVVLVKDINERVIGMEIINFRRKENQESFAGAVEVFEEDLDLLRGLPNSE